MINYALSKEIYGLTAWFVDAHSLPGLLGVLNSVENLAIPEEKHNSINVYVPKSDTRIIDRPFGDGWTRGQLENSDEFNAIAVIKLDGPITLNGGASSFGMKQLSQQMIKISKDSRVKAFIVYTDSGGGASGAVKVMSDTINTIKKETPVFGMIQKGGMAASAAFGILSACTKIYSEDKMNIVGSAGTMIQFAGREANSEDKDGVKHIRIYASKSTKKNEGFEAALNDDNYKILKDKLLDPINEDFLSLIESNRPILKGTKFNDGHTVFSKDAVGTFIDGIKSFDELVNEISSTDSFINNNSNNNLNTNTMTKSELKSKHPAIFQEVYNEGLENGISAERDRSGAWMAHLATDSAAVIAGIESGENISMKQTQEFIVKQNSKLQLESLAGDSAAAAPTGEASNEIGKDKDAVDNFYAGIDSKLNLKKD